MKDKFIFAYLRNHVENDRLWNAQCKNSDNSYTCWINDESKLNNLWPIISLCSFRIYQSKECGSGYIFNEKSDDLSKSQNGFLKNRPFSIIQYHF